MDARQTGREGCRQAEGEDWWRAEQGEEAGRTRRSGPCGGGGGGAAQACGTGAAGRGGHCSGLEAAAQRGSAAASPRTSCCARAVRTRASADARAHTHTRSCTQTRVRARSRSRRPAPAPAPAPAPIKRLFGSREAARAIFEAGYVEQYRAELEEELKDGPSPTTYLPPEHTTHEAYLRAHLVASREE